jgi:acyl carrier protein
MTSMDRSEALALVATVLAVGLGVPEEDVTPEASLRDDLGMDSLDLIELVTGLEARLGKQVPEAELTGVHTVEDAVDLVLDVVAGERVTR